MTRDEWKVGETRYFRFNTHKADGTPITLAGTPSISAYLASNLTEITTGITLSVDSDSKTGTHLVTVDTSSGYAVDTDVDFFISAGTVDSISQVGVIVKTVRIIAVDEDGIVSHGALAGGGSTTAFTLPSGQRTNVQIGDILKPAGIPARIIATYNSGTGAGTVTTAFASDPSSLAYVVFGSAPSDNTLPFPADVRQLLGTAWLTPGTAGTPDVNTKLAGGTAWGSGAITAGSIASDAITDAKVASDVTIASVTGAVGSVTGNVGGNVTGSVGSVATGGITAASIAADAIGASELATDAAQEIADALLDRASAVEGYTLRQLLRLFAAALVGKADGLNGTTAHFRDVADTKNRITATVDTDGNRTAVTLDAT